MRKALEEGQDLSPRLHESSCEVSSLTVLFDVLRVRFLMLFSKLEKICRCAERIHDMAGDCVAKIFGNSIDQRTRGAKKLSNLGANLGNISPSSCFEVIEVGSLKNALISP